MNSKEGLPVLRINLESHPYYEREPYQSAYYAEVMQISFRTGNARVRLYDINESKICSNFDISIGYMTGKIEVCI